MKPTNDDVLTWARSVGMEITDDPFVNFNVWELKRVCTFAYAAGAADMKERCAKVCEEFEIPKEISGAHPDYLEGKHMAVHQCAEAIRALMEVK